MINRLMKQTFLHFFTYLGVVINKHLTWQDHIEYIYRMIRQQQTLWKLLSRRRAEHRLIFLYKCFNNLFSHSFKLNFNKDIYSYNTKIKNNIRKTLAKRNWGLWTSINFANNEWNQLDMGVRQMNSSSKFKKAIRNADINLI